MRVLLSDDVPAAQLDVPVVVGLDEGVHWTHDAGLKGCYFYLRNLFSLGYVLNIFYGYDFLHILLTWKYTCLSRRITFSHVCKGMHIHHHLSSLSCVPIWKSNSER